MSPPLDQLCGHAGCCHLHAGGLWPKGRRVLVSRRADTTSWASPPMDILECSEVGNQDGKVITCSYPALLPRSLDGEPEAQSLRTWNDLGLHGGTVGGGGLWTVPAPSPHFSIRAAGFYSKVGRAARFVFCVPSPLSSSCSPSASALSCLRTRLHRLRV